MTNTPSWALRRTYYQLLGLKIGKNSKILSGTFIIGPHHIEIGENTIVWHHCFLDGRIGLRIGNNVSVSLEACVLSQTHDVRSPDFALAGGVTILEDRCWLGTRSMVLPGLKIGEGAVVAAGAVVTCDVEPYTIVAGVPARLVGTRPKDLTYRLELNHPW